MRSLAILAAALVALGNCAAEAEIRATATLHLEKPGPRIAPEIFGQFSEQLGKGITDGIWVGEDSPIANVNGFRAMWSRR